MICCGDIRAVRNIFGVNCDNLVKAKRFVKDHVIDINCVEGSFGKFYPNQVFPITIFNISTITFFKSKLAFRSKPSAKISNKAHSIPLLSYPPVPIDGNFVVSIFNAMTTKIKPIAAR